MCAPFAGSGRVKGLGLIELTLGPMASVDTLAGPLVGDSTEGEDVTGEG